MARTLGSAAGPWAEIDTAAILSFEGEARKRLEGFAVESGVPAECRVLRGEASRLRTP